MRRPKGVYYQPGTEDPTYGPSQNLDFELEMGYFVSKPVPFAETMDIADAKEHIFGFVLLNDWSARDLQMFEMRPLGPFHSKGNRELTRSMEVLAELRPRLRNLDLELDHHIRRTGAFQLQPKDCARSGAIRSSSLEEQRRRRSGYQAPCLANKSVLTPSASQLVAYVSADTSLRPLRNKEAV